MPGGASHLPERDVSMRGDLLLEIEEFGIAAGAAGIAKILFGLFLILALVFIVLAALGVGAAKKALD